VPISFGEALLAPTVLYPPITEALFHAGIRVRYAVNVTGHGWRKLLRHPASLTYRIDTLPPVPAVLGFMQRQLRMSDAEAYGTLNMGAGFALFVAAADAERTLEVAKSQGIDAWVAGQVEAGPKRLLVEPLGIEFGGDALQLR
jgi:phosphoribosylformylglycinamidine cyclo-ligase